MEFGKIQNIDVREIWKSEPKDFTPWLNENIDFLNECLDINIQPVGIEQPAGAFSIDILAEDMKGDKVIIENQFDKINHDHLGKALTYMAYHDAKTIVLICEDSRSEHEKVITWLNENTPDDVSFYLVTFKVIKIDESRPYPIFTKICGPSDKAKEIRRNKEEVSEREDLILNFWETFLDKLNKNFPEHSGSNLSKNPWLLRSAGKTGVNWSYYILNSRAVVELLFDSNDKELNIERFKELKNQKQEIELQFGKDLEWNFVPTRRSQKVSYKLNIGGLNDKIKWDLIQNEMIKSMKALFKSIKPFLDEIFYL